jgi:hypothetical protein
MTQRNSTALPTLGAVSPILLYRMNDVKVMTIIRKGKSKENTFLGANHFISNQIINLL